MNFPGKPSKKQVLGIHVDGTDLRIAQLGWENGEVAIYALENVTLPVRLGKLSTVGQQAALVDEKVGDVFGFEEEQKPTENPMDIEDEFAESGDLSNTLINVFSKYPLQSHRIAVNIPEGQATYYNFESDFGLKGKKLVKRLFEEISPLAGGNLDSAIIDHFRTEEGGITVVVSEGQIPIIEELIDIKNYLPGGVPYFSRVNSNEIALVNLARMALDPPEDKIIALVYIGCDFSRVIIMRGGEPISFIQAIREGYQSPQICQTMFSKILLEQEEAGIPDIDQIVLAGEIGVTRAIDFFQRQFPEADVKPITPGPLDTSLLKNEELAIFSNFAIPVSLAWEVLESKNPRWIKVDLMPNSIRESQKAFKIAWHGFALLGIIFVMMLLLSYQGFERSGKIKNLQASIQNKQNSISALQTDLITISKLQSDINQRKVNLEFLHNIIADPYKWSRLFEKLSEDFKSVNRIWIERIQSTPHGFNMIGKALTRDRIPALAAGLDGVHLERVTRIISEKGNVVYEFQLSAELPPPPPEKESVKQTVGGDKAIGSSGSIAPPAATTKPVPKQTPPEKEPVKQMTGGKATKSNRTVSPPEKTARPVQTQTAGATVHHIQPSPNNIGSVASAGSAKAIIPTSESAADLYQKGIQLIKNHDVQKALTAFKNLVDQFPNSRDVPAAYYWSGECYYATKEYRAAAQAFEQSLSYPKNSKRAAGMLMLGISYQKLGERDKARRQFEELINAYPEGEYTNTAKRRLKSLVG